MIMYITTHYENKTNRKKNRKERKEVNEGERITVDRTWRKRES